MLFGHDANIGCAAKERQRKMPLPYSNWPTTKNDDRDAEGIAEAATGPFDAFCRAEEPGPTRHADAPSIPRPVGPRADGADQSAARHPAGTRDDRAPGQAEAGAVSERADGRTGRSGIESSDGHSGRRRSRAMGRTRPSN